jgi:phage tail sheath protein FI
MAQYLSPGVYVEEVDRGSRPIEGVGTAVAAFVGFTEKGPREAQLITSWEQYRSMYGSFIEGAYLPTSVYGYFLNGGRRCYVVRVSPTVNLPQRNSSKTALEVTPLLTAGFDEQITVDVSDATTPGHFKLTVRRGDAVETFDDLSSDKKNKAGRYVEQVVNDPAKGSKLIRVFDASGSLGSTESRIPQLGSYNFSANGSSGPVAELPAPTVRFNSNTAKDVPVVEFRHAPNTSGAVNIEISDIQGQDEMFKVTVKLADETETFDVSFKKNAQYLEQIINNSKTGSKLVRVKDLSGDTNLNPAERRPGSGNAQLHGTASAPKGKERIEVGPGDFTGDVADRTGVGGLEALDDVTIVAMPDLMGLYQRGQIDMKGVQIAQTAMMNHCEAMHDRVAILDAPPDMSPQQIRNWRLKEANYDSKYAALYYPWIEVEDPLQRGKTMMLPPSGHMAGIWTRNDSERGVFKAPANEVVRGAVGLERQITMNEQDSLNPEGINCIRAFPGRGIRVWGARTLSSDPQWRYLNVRRLFNFIEASIQRGTQWVVFEPNDMDLWQRIRRDITSFLYQTWLSGALFGATPDQAFFVKCDEETNPPELIDAGRVTIEIGISPVKPAEFVVFRIGQLVNSSFE